MSAHNPYEEFLDSRSPETVLAATVSEVAFLLKAVGPAKAATRPAPGKWSAAEIICHLADCELVFGFRLRQTLAEEGPTIQPFDQEKWAVTYPGIPASQGLEVFSALRGWNLCLLNSALPDAAVRTFTHPGRGVITFQTFLETIAGHDLDHIGQLRKLAAGPFAE